MVETKDAKKEETPHSTIFHEIMLSDLPPEEKSQERLHDEAQVVVGAGVETTKWTLTVAMYHILSQPRILSKLREEIISVYPDEDSPPSLTALEKLPYLVAVTQEGMKPKYNS
jgi:cytochrome P450